MGKTFKKRDLLENADIEDVVLDEEEINELIDVDGSMIDNQDNFKATDRDVKSKGTSRDQARRSSQGPASYYPWGGAFYGGYYTMNEEEEMDFDPRDEDDDIPMWNKPQKDVPEEYKMGIPPRIDDEGKKDHDNYPEKRKDVYHGYFESELKGEIDGIAENRMQALVDEMLQKRKYGDIVKRTNETDVMNDKSIPEFSELKTTYERPIVARKVIHLTDLMNKQELGSDEVAIVMNYLIDNLDLSKISNEYRELLGDKLKYGEQEGE
jgi:hypothetical protein